MEDEIEKLLIKLKKGYSLKKLYNFFLYLSFILYIATIFVDIERYDIVLLLALASVINYRFAKDDGVKIEIVEQIMKLKRENLLQNKEGIKG